MNKTFNLLVLGSLATLVGCSGPSTTPAKFQISTGFAVTSSGYGGGLIVFGENSAKGKKFSVPVIRGLEMKLDLEPGDWKFGAIGWDGTSPFSGTPQCGSVSSTLSSAAPQVELKLSAANCSSAAFTSEIEMKTMYVSACGAFYQYSAGTFGPITSPSFCSSLPTSLQNNLYTHYRFFAVDTIGSKLGFQSQCSSFLAGGSVAFNLPTKKVPLSIQLYRKLEDCQSGIVTADPLYTFVGGLQADQSQNFDAHFDGANSTVTLPAGKLKRATSPFMNLMPRITCNAGDDCIGDLNPSADRRIPWSTRSAPIEVADAGNKTCGDVSTNAPGFIQKNCFVGDNKVKVEIERHPLYCLDTTMIYTVKKVVARFNKIFILHTVPGGDQAVSIYEFNGTLFKRVMLPSFLFVDLDVSNNYVVLAGPQTFAFPWMAANPSPANIGVGSSLNVTIDDGQHVYYVPSTGLVRVYNILSPGTSYTSLPVSDSILDIGVHNNELFVLTNGAYQKLTAYNLNSTTLEHSSEYFPANYTDSFHGFDIHEGKAILLKSGLLTSFDFIPGNILSAPSTVSGSYTSAILPSFHAGKVFLADGNFLKIQTYGVNNNLVDTTGNCTGQILVSGQPPLSISSGRNDSFLAMDTGIKLVGRTKFTNQKPFDFFPSLSESRHGEDKSSAGYLSHVQDLLGPNGIGAAFPNLTCADLMLPLGSTLTRSLDVPDGETGTLERYTATVTSGLGTPMTSSICDDTNLNNSTCAPTPFDFIIKVKRENTSVRREDFELRLKCSKRIGIFELFEDEGTRTSKEKVKWNTQSPIAQRYVRHTQEVENDIVESTVAKVVKRAVDDIQARALEVRANRTTYNSDIRLVQWMRTAVEYDAKAFEYTDNYVTPKPFEIFPTPVTLPVLRAQNTYPVAWLGASCATNSFFDPSQSGGCLFFDAAPELSQFSSETDVRIDTLFNDGTDFDSNHFRPESSWD